MYEDEINEDFFIEELSDTYGGRYTYKLVFINLSEKYVRFTYKGAKSCLLDDECIYECDEYGDYSYYLGLYKQG